MENGEFQVNTRLWNLYCSGVNDMNPLHRNRAYVTSFNDRFSALYGKELRDIVAPGMFVASHALLGSQLSTIESIMFRAPVYSGETLRVVDTTNDSGARSYNFMRPGEKRPICTVRGVTPLSPFSCSGALPCTAMDDDMHVYTPLLKAPDGALLSLQAYLWAFEQKAPRSESFGLVPSAYLASLSAPALLSYGHAHNLGDILHLRQTFEQYAPITPEEHLRIQIGNAQDAGSNRLTLAEQWVIGPEDKPRMVARGISDILTVPFVEDTL